MNRKYLVILILLCISAFTLGCCSGLEKPAPKKRPLIPPRVAPPPGKKLKPIVANCTKKPVVIAVIDTGFGTGGRGKEANLCKFGHKDFSKFQETSTDYNTTTPVPVDNHGHGTNIAGIVDEYARNSEINYCIVILKYYDPKASNGNNLKSTINAIKYATSIGVKFINYSGGGTDYSQDEKDAVQKFLDKGGTFVAAAGNEKSDVEKPGNKYYPALYDPKIISVGNLGKDGKISKTSNYGKSISRWEVGEDVSAYDITMTGTSQAAAVATGKIVSELKNTCN